MKNFIDSLKKIRKCQTVKSIKGVKLLKLFSDNNMSKYLDYSNLYVSTPASSYPRFHPFSPITFLIREHISLASNCRLKRLLQRRLTLSDNKLQVQVCVVVVVVVVVAVVETASRMNMQ